jgi:von Willebrand factor type A domain
MKNIHFVAVLGILAAAGLTPVAVCAAEADGVAVAIVYDTSGSMKEQVRDGAGKLTPKCVIANRALENIATRIQTFATNTTTGTPRNIQAGLFVFDGTRARQAVKFGPFDANAFKDWARKFSSPNGGTPLGNALAEAGKTVLNSGLVHKHVLIITDGINTQGPAPAAVMPRVKQQAEGKQTVVSIHFVAFDVDASVFSGVKELGATVVGAADEIQLNKQLEFILEKKILLEDEEPPKKQ